MFSSFRTKLIVLIVVIIFVITLATIFFIRRDISDIVVRTEKSRVEDALNFAELIISGAYANLIQEKIDIVSVHKKQLRQIGDFSMTVLEQYADMTGKSNISIQEIENLLADMVESESNMNQTELMIFDMNGDIIYHSNPLYQGQSAASWKDIKGIPLTDKIFRSENTSGDTGAHIVFNRPGRDRKTPEKYLAYMKPFRNWDWVMSPMVNIGQLEKESEEKFQKVIAELEKLLAGFHIRETGSVFVLDENGKSIISPSDQSDDFHLQTHHRNGRRLFDDIVEAVKSGASFIEYQSETHRSLYAYIRYFKGLKWYIMAEIPADELVAPAKRLVFRQVLIIFSVFVCSLPVIIFVVNRFTTPLKTLATYAKKIPHQNLTASKEEDDPIEKYPVIYQDEIGRLAESILKMKSELKNTIQSMIESAKVNERIENELNIARKIQLGLVPPIEKLNPPDEIDLYAVLEPAKEVGGDLYDFFMIDDTHLCFTIGDVSGKGIPAAMFMVITRTLVKVLAENISFSPFAEYESETDDFQKTWVFYKPHSPADILYHLNNILSADNPNNMFVTMIVGVVHLPTGTLTWTNGGHNPPVMISRHRQSGFMRLKGGTVLGFMKKMKFPESTIILEPGDAVLFYTDGISEAMNTSGEMFTEARLLETLKGLQKQSAQNIGVGLYENIKAFRGTAHPSDDIAMLVLRYRGNP